VPLLMLFGTLLGGHQMGRAALIARRQLDQGQGDRDFLTAKLAMAYHYTYHVLPEALALARTVTHGSRTVMALPAALL
jgi:hypothetical protein